MSLFELVKNEHKPYLSPRVNNIVVDGDIHIVGEILIAGSALISSNIVVGEMIFNLSGGTTGLINIQVDKIGHMCYLMWPGVTGFTFAAESTAGELSVILPEGLQPHNGGGGISTMLHSIQGSTNAIEILEINANLLNIRKVTGAYSVAEYDFLPTVLTYSTI